MQALELKSDIHAVTVYRQGATVTRRALLAGDLAKDSTLRIADLPLSLQDSSLCSRIVCSTGDSGLLASDLQVVLDAPMLDGAAADAQDAELLRLRRLAQRLQERLGDAEQELARAIAMVPRPKAKSGQAPEPSPLQARLSLIAFTERRLQALQAEQRAIELEYTQVSEDLEALEQKHAQASTEQLAKRHELRKAVVIRTQGQLHTGAESFLEIDYFVPGATWAPSYSIAFGKQLQSATLSMRAMVSQRSGEDWREVELTLSTADALRWAELPELTSRRIGRRQAPPSKRGWRPPPSGLAALYADYDGAFGTTPPPSYSQLFGGVSPMAGAVMEDARFGDFEDEVTAVSSGQLDAYAPRNAPPAPPSAMSAPLAPVQFSMSVNVGGESDEITKVSRHASRERSEPKAKKLGQALSGPMPSKPPAPGGGGGELQKESYLKEEEAGEHNPLLSYARLRMPGAASTERGTLQEVSTRAMYSETLSDPTIARQVMGVFDYQLSRASDLGALPTGHTRPWCQDYDYAFRAHSRLDVESDGRFHSLPIQEADAKSRAQHVVVPRESTEVFRTVTVDNPFDGPLLSGPMDVYWHGDFLLTSAVEFTAARGELELGLGVDQSVKVVRNTHFREDTVGMMGGALELTHKIVIEVSNNASQGIELQVRERVPVPARSNEEEVRVEIKSVAPPWQPFEPLAEGSDRSALRGGYVWALHLDAGGRAELNASYEIKLSSKFELRGGNRREW